MYGTAFTITATRDRKCSALVTTVFFHTDVLERETNFNGRRQNFTSLTTEFRAMHLFPG